MALAIASVIFLIFVFHARVNVHARHLLSSDAPVQQLGTTFSRYFRVLFAALLCSGE